MDEKEATITKNEIDTLSYTLALRLRSCKQYMACDLCPFSYEGKDEKDENYHCRLSDSARVMLGYIIDEDVEVMEW